MQPLCENMNFWHGKVIDKVIVGQIIAHMDCVTGLWTIICLNISFLKKKENTSVLIKNQIAGEIWILKFEMIST